MVPRRWIFGLTFALSSLSIPALLAAAIQEEAPVVDIALEKRLVRETVYRTHAGDTLRGIARLLYAHSTWWRKLRVSSKKGQPPKNYGPDDPLPEKLEIVYRAPALGDVYTVQKDDYLIRIAQWKYGHTDRWEAIFHRNAGTISDPNLIRPGDKLYFGADGTVQLSSTGSSPAAESARKTLIKGFGKGLAGDPCETDTDGDASSTTAAAGSTREPVAGASTERGPASPASSQDSGPLASPLASAPLPLLLGAILGALVFMITPLTWLGARRNHRALAAAGASIPPPDVPDREEHEFRKELKKRSRGGRRKDDLGFDRSLVPRHGSDIDRRPNYFSLLRKHWKRYLK